MLSVDIDGEEESVELLRDIVELWLTIRGFSIAGQWMEIYKKCSSKTTKKSKSLRKTLKQGTGHAFFLYIQICNIYHSMQCIIMY